MQTLTPLAVLSLLVACGGKAPADSADTATGPTPVSWSKVRAQLVQTSAGGRAWKRGIIHLHSHFSHDACDNNPMPGGVPDEACLQDLRDALCDSALDYAMLTDHPAHAGERPFADLFLLRGDDVLVEGVANRMACASGQRPLVFPGVEDELMPVTLERHVADTPAENDRIYNGSGAETIDAEIAAGGKVLQAHTEGQPLEVLLERQALGQIGVEMFNLHAMVDPNKREEDLGLERFSYLDALAPFLNGETTTEPDLAFLGFYEEQGVSLEKWDALSAVAPTVGTAGTDAHQNALPNLLSDGERVDSYRRMIRWFSNILLVDGDAPADVESALAAGRNLVAFEVLGTPADFNVSYAVGQEAPLEMAGTGARGGTLHVTCPTLAADTPQDGSMPEITVTVFKDGQAWAEGCGDYVLADPGVYRVRADILPLHLQGFLDASTAGLMKRFPWLYSGAFRVQ